jgi:hypothetical protein
MNLRLPGRIDFPPLIALLVRSRVEARIIALASLAHILLITFHLPTWQCPFKAATGFPCPGCYLGTAIQLLLSGHWSQAFSVHLFAPFFLVGILFIGIVSFLPDPLLFSISQKIANIERRSGVTVFFFFSFLFYWSLRLFWLGFD